MSQNQEIGELFHVVQKRGVTSDEFWGPQVMKGLVGNFFLFAESLFL